jgi:hypothetical protein
MVLIRPVLAEKLRRKFELKPRTPAERTAVTDRAQE